MSYSKYSALYALRRIVVEMEQAMRIARGE
jgi:hypothetical protein